MRINPPETVNEWKFHSHLSNGVIRYFSPECVSNRVCRSVGRDFTVQWGKKLKTIICQWTEVQRRGGSRITFISFGNWSHKDSNVLLHAKVSLVWKPWRAGVFDLAMFSLSHTHKPHSSSTPVLSFFSFVCFTSSVSLLQEGKHQSCCRIYGSGLCSRSLVFIAYVVTAARKLRFGHEHETPW